MRWLWSVWWCPGGEPGHSPFLGGSRGRPARVGRLLVRDQTIEGPQRILRVQDPSADANTLRPVADVAPVANGCLCGAVPLGDLAGRVEVRHERLHLSDGTSFEMGTAEHMEPRLKVGPQAATVAGVSDHAVTLDELGPDVERVNLSPYAVALPRTFGGTVDRSDLPYLVHLELDFDGNRVQCRNLTCRRRADGAPITSEGMTKVRVAELVYLVADEAKAEVSTFFPPDGASGAVVVTHDVDIPAAPPGRAGPGPEHLRALGIIYTTAYACGGSPRRAVMERLSLTRTTANRWIRLARESGYLRGGGDDDGEHPAEA